MLSIKSKFAFRFSCQNVLTRNRAVYTWRGEKTKITKQLKVLSRCSNAYKLHDNAVSVAKECWAFLYPNNCLLFSCCIHTHNLFQWNCNIMGNWMKRYMARSQIAFLYWFTNKIFTLKTSKTFLIKKSI